MIFAIQWQWEKLGVAKHLLLFKYWKKNTIEIIDDMYKNDDEKRIHYIKVFTTFFDENI